MNKQGAPVNRGLAGLAFLLLAYTVGCDAKPNVPEAFKTQLRTFLERGTKMCVLVEQGISYMRFQEELASVKTAHVMLYTMWPPALDTPMRVDFERAIHAWELTLDLWKLKLEEKDNPTEPNINGWKEYEAFGEDLWAETRGRDDIVPEYRGKRFLPFDENVSRLMTIGATNFTNGHLRALAFLKD